MNHSNQLAAWRETQKVLLQLYERNSSNPWYQEYEQVTRLSEVNNPWFTQDQIQTALQGIIRLLEPDSLEKWISNYPQNHETPKQVGVIMAGNVPLAGFHDFLCVLLSGNRLIAKLSRSDRFLLPFISNIYFSFIPELRSRFEISDQLKNTDAIIATGSNNTSRYFEYYFGKKPHIFRKTETRLPLSQVMKMNMIFFSWAKIFSSILVWDAEMFPNCMFRKDTTLMISLTIWFNLMGSCNIPNT